MSSLNKEIFYKIDEGDSDDEIEEVAMANFERSKWNKQWKKVVEFLKKVDKSIKSASSSSFQELGLSMG